MKFQKIANSFICIIWVFSVALYGCAGTNNKVYSENHTDKIAIIGESKVVYPRMGGDTPLLDLGASKKALEIHLHKSEEIFRNKGYSVVFSKPAGVGYFYVNGDNWVVEDYANSDNKWQIKNGDPVYEYPEATENREFRKAVKKAFERAEVANNVYQFNSFKPIVFEKDLDTLRQITGADTICFNRIYGNKYTTARKVGDVAAKIGMTVVGAMFGVVVIPSGPLQDSVGSSVTCLDASSGDVIWHAWKTVNDDPVDPDGNIMNELLKLYPDRGQPIDVKYKM